MKIVGRKLIDKDYLETGRLLDVLVKYYQICNFAFKQIWFWLVPEIQIDWNSTNTIDICWSKRDVEAGSEKNRASHGWAWSCRRCHLQLQAILDCQKFIVPVLKYLDSLQQNAKHFNVSF